MARFIYKPLCFYLHIHTLDQLMSAKSVNKSSQMCCHCSTWLHHNCSSLDAGTMIPLYYSTQQRLAKTQALYQCSLLVRVMVKSQLFLATPLAQLFHPPFPTSHLSINLISHWLNIWSYLLLHSCNHFLYFFIESEFPI